MKKIILLSVFYFITLTVFGVVPKKILLVLGSDNIATLNERINTAYTFLLNNQIDVIIVSGGCGAHNSSICEATQMANKLIAKGISSNKIYKEEYAKNTVQNYIFSRELVNQNGEKLIKSGDTLYVLSNHWHAIAVAARFREYDNVDSYYHIQGSISPSKTDKVDYVGILHGETDNEKFILKGTWPTPKAVWRDGYDTFYQFQNFIYKTNQNLNSFELRSNKDYYKEFSDITNKNVAYIDAEKVRLICDDSIIYVFDKSKNEIITQFKKEEYLKNIPIHLVSSIFYSGLLLKNKLYLFYKDSILILYRKGKIFEYLNEIDAKTLIPNWPYAWGKCNISAVKLEVSKNEITFYNNKEYIRTNLNFEKLEENTKLNLKFPY